MLKKLLENCKEVTISASHDRYFKYHKETFKIFGSNNMTLKPFEDFTTDEQSSLFNYDVEFLTFAEHLDYINTLITCFSINKKDILKILNIQKDFNKTRLLK